MANHVDPDYFRQLAAMAPDEVCRRAACRYDSTDRCYELTVWERQYAIYPHEEKIVTLQAGTGPTHAFFPLVVIYYLLRCQGTDPSGQWVSEKDLPGGPTFFRGPHEIPTRMISRRFGNDLNAFSTVCAHLSGNRLEMGDAAYRFEITPRIPAAVLLWQGDEELPPEARIMYDATITRHLTLDMVFVLATEICTRIGDGA